MVRTSQRPISAEFAMVYGLAHLDDVFEMAEEWGIQYDN